MVDINSKYLEAVRELSDRIVEAQRPIRILDSIKWGPEIRESFFQSGYRELPAVDREYYQRHNRLDFDPGAKRVELHELAITDYEKIPEIMDNFLEVIETVGPNPYKGM